MPGIVPGRFKVPPGHITTMLSQPPQGKVLGACPGIEVKGLTFPGVVEIGVKFGLLFTGIDGKVVVFVGNTIGVG